MNLSINISINLTLSELPSLIDHVQISFINPLLSNLNPIFLDLEIDLKLKNMYYTSTDDFLTLLYILEIDK